MPKPTTPPADVRQCIPHEQVRDVAGFGAKTLERLAKKGEAVGRFKVGDKVLVHLPTLNAWLAARAAAAIAVPDAALANTTP